MATTQEALDLKFDILQAEKEEKLKELFSPEIIAFARRNNLNTFQQLSEYVGILDLSSSQITALKGLELLKGITYLTLTSNRLIELPTIGAMESLTRLYLGGNGGLTGIGNISQLKNIEVLHLYSCELVDFGGISKMTNLTIAEIQTNNITDIGSISALTLLTTLRVNNNNLTTAKVDAILSQAKTLKQNGGNISLLQLSVNAVPTGGASNTDYTYLVGQGVTVTIDV